jgi:hypothetical protein
MKITKKFIEKVLANPFYCIKIHPELGWDHPLIVSEEDWIKSNVMLIKEMGTEKWLKSLLDILKGNFDWYEDGE